MIICGIINEGICTKKVCIITTALIKYKPPWWRGADHPPPSSAEVENE
jgi:hypothetical protein